MPTLSDFTATTITGDDQPLESYAGKVALVVNTASKCGFTPQFEGLEKLHQEYADQGLVVLGFPCNQFGSQDPGSNEEIGAFCQRNYGVTFQMFEKIDVNGDDAHPLYEKYVDQGLVILGFPCNQFAGQEPGTADEIGAFCQRNYGVSFPMFEKVDVNGDDAHPLFTWLREEKGGVLGDAIKWNFTKFLVGKDGTVIKRYGSTTAPEKIASDIEKALAA